MPSAGGLKRETPPPVPGMGGHTGDLYFRRDGDPRVPFPGERARVGPGCWLRTGGISCAAAHCLREPVQLSARRVGVGVGGG